MEKKIVCEVMGRQEAAVLVAACHKLKGSQGETFSRHFDGGPGPSGYASKLCGLPETPQELAAQPSFEVLETLAAISMDKDLYLITSLEAVELAVLGFASTFWVAYNRLLDAVEEGGTAEFASEVKQVYRELADKVSTAMKEDAPEGPAPPSSPDDAVKQMRTALNKMAIGMSLAVEPMDVD